MNASFMQILKIISILICGMIDQKLLTKTCDFLRFLFFLDKLFAYVFVLIFQMVEDMTKINQYSTFKI